MTKTLIRTTPPGSVMVLDRVNGEASRKQKVSFIPPIRGREESRNDMAHDVNTPSRDLIEQNARNIRKTQAIMAQLYKSMAKAELPQRRPAEDFPELAAFR